MASSKKNIVIIGSAYPLRGGGIATFNERMARAFMANGDEVLIHTFSLQYPSFLFPGKTQYSDEAPPKDLNIEVSVNSMNPFNWVKIGRRIKKMAPDLVILRYWIPYMAPCLGTIARIIRKNKKTKVIAIADNIIPHEHKPGDKLLTSYFVKQVDGFITMSESVLKDLSTFDTKKPRQYTPHPLYDNFGDIISREEALQQLHLDPKYRYLLFFGFIRDYKGLDWLLQSLSNQWFKDKPIKLIVAGEFYVDSQKYLDIIEKNNLQDKVVLRTDFIPNEKVNLYFCAADMVVQPYKTATQSGVTQIAYHFNKPMLVTNVGGLSEIVPHEKVGYVVDCNTDAIATALIDFFEQDKQEAFVKNVAQEKTKYSWQTMITSIEQVYHKILNTNKS